jgi:hypothetical protein
MVQAAHFDRERPYRDQAVPRSFQQDPGHQLIFAQKPQRYRWGFVKIGATVRKLKTKIVRHCATGRPDSIPASFKVIESENIRNFFCVFCDRQVEP